MKQMFCYIQYTPCLLYKEESKISHASGQNGSADWLWCVWNEYIPDQDIWKLAPHTYFSPFHWDVGFQGEPWLDDEDRYISEETWVYRRTVYIQNDVSFHVYFQCDIALYFDAFL